MGKKQVWYEVQENETIEQCLDRMKQDGYMPCGRKEEPVFQEVNGEPTYLRQKIQFKGILLEEQ
ncbi:NETI motif-containing protein [Lysinibacillus sp. LZ02]|uniref:NETI motif-containing protein n=1 Tax=Lysinibacillus sp. LZ02 TaxID=3420668 RepID=UPI003D360A9B